jgi:hypothetical protein
MNKPRWAMVDGGHRSLLIRMNTQTVALEVGLPFTHNRPELSNFAFWSIKGSRPVNEAEWEGASGLLGKHPRV